MALTGGFAAAFPRWSCEQLFALASDIERYPDFIPWYVGVRVVAEDGTTRTVDNRLRAGPVALAFRSRAVAEPPHRLAITADDGPFRAFRLVWSFAPAGAGCAVRADYTVDFRSPLVQGLAHLAVHEVERRVLRCFESRALELYG